MQAHFRQMRVKWLENELNRQGLSEQIELYHMALGLKCDQTHLRSYNSCVIELFRMLYERILTNYSIIDH